MFKASFFTPFKMTKREQNDYVNKCEGTLKNNTKGYQCLKKNKHQTENGLTTEIIYEAESHRIDEAENLTFV